jgi:hypothetical protein
MTPITFQISAKALTIQKLQCTLPLALLFTASPYDFLFLCPARPGDFERKLFYRIRSQFLFYPVFVEVNKFWNTIFVGNR